MPTITFLPSQRTLEIKRGTNLMEAVQEAGLPIGSSCGAVAVCAKCHVTIAKGAENLSRINPPEQKLLDREKFPTDRRISCLTRVLGDVTISTTYW